MPLIKGKSPKAFEHNIKAEIGAGKPQKQALAIAYDVKRRSGKKKASGGTVESGSRDMNYAEGGTVTVKEQKRPMPEREYNDAKNISENRGKKPLLESGWTDQPTLAQARNPGMKGTKIKHPKMVKSDVLQVRLRDEEDDLQESAGTNEGPQRQPPAHDNEEGPDRQGPEVPDMSPEHSTGRKPYAKGGKIEAGDSTSHNMYKRTSMEPKDDPESQELRTWEADHMDYEGPSEDEGEARARHQNEEYQRQTSGNPDMAKPHNEYQTEPYDGVEDAERPSDEDYDTSRTASAYARGGEVSPNEEEGIEHHDSIAAAIMARRERAKAEIDSGSRDEDLAVRYAQGGEITKERGDILSEGAMDSDDSSQVDLSRNADEDQNQEDQASFHALEKENYSESDGLNDLTYDTDRSEGDSEEDDTSDAHDMVSSIRRKMKARRRDFSDN